MQLLLLGAVLMLILAPFAGFAPLLLVLFLTAVGYAAWTIGRVLLLGDAD
ncbi:MAG: hypothetical protein HC890_09930 [Chloroflexaceae bacterium]|nr:hypothetical protein [Chloroflexaceae bacterium]